MIEFLYPKFLLLLTLNGENISDKKLSVEDQKLYKLCKKYGAQTLSARRKFAGLLPEAFRRRLFQKKGSSSIFEFAAKLSGMSQEQVRLVLNLEKRFEDKPVLKNLLINGEVSINKLARVVSIATAKNEHKLAEQVKLLPNRALETLVRDEKFARIIVDSCNKNTSRPEEQNGLQKAFIEVKSLHVQTVNLDFEITNDIKTELNELHSKGIDVNELLQKMLEQRKENIAQEKEKISEEIHQSPCRYIPVRIKKILNQEYGTKCSIPICKKPSKQIHHTQRFSLSQNHDAKYLAPLCAEHHTIAHSIDIKFHKIRRTTITR